ncbi:O-antigen ligase family protein [Bradyrhizobium hipponense]|uniref:O-antigen ligase family protein n=1 Tax=Bradyrhizobium hipponense TaxID=2605638 RepID=UPI0016533F47|nr:O-antigen ligase family protein [Bradyrhizobium hipponense]
MSGVLLRSLSLTLLSLLPIASLVYFLSLQLLGINHESSYFAVWSVAVWFIPLALLLPNLIRRQVSITAIDVTFCLVSVLLAVHLKVFTLHAGLRDWALLVTFWVGPYAAARLVSAQDITRILKILGAIALTVSAAVFTWQFSLQLTAGDNLRPVMLGLNHGVLIVAVALGISVVIQVSDASAKYSLATYARPMIAALVTADLVVLGARGVVIADIATALLMVLAPTRDGRRGRIVVFAAIFVGATLALILNHVARDFMVRTYLPLEPPAGAGLPDFGVPGLGVPGLGRDSRAECDQLNKMVDSTPIRIWLLQQGFLLFQETPVFGIGLENFAAHTCPGSFPHSTILQAFVEMGAVGGIAYALLLATAIFSLIGLTINRLPCTSRPVIVVLALLSFFIILDQFYGRILLSSTASLLLGFSASLVTRSEHPHLRGRPIPNSENSR